MDGPVPPRLESLVHCSLVSCCPGCGLLFSWSGSIVLGGRYLGPAVIGCLSCCPRVTRSALLASSRRYVGKQWLVRQEYEIAAGC